MNRMRTYGRHTVVLIGLGALIGAVATADAQTDAKYYRATITPSIVYLQPGAKQAFKSVIAATRLMAAQAPTSVKWAVNDIPGGNATVGVIDKNGLYTAPTVIPSPREVHVCATVPEAANRYLWATVIIGDGPPRYKSVGLWSEPVLEGKERTEHLVDPHGIALDKDGNLLIADQLGSAVLRFTAEGKYLGRLDSGKGSEPGQVTEPRIVEVDRKGRIYVSDSKGDRPRIQVWSHGGRFLRIFGPKGMQPGMLLRCHGMGFDPDGNLYTTDVDNMRVNVYDPAGNFLYDWGKEGLDPGTFNAPHGIYVDRNADVFVTGYYGPTQKFNKHGDFLLAFAHGDPPDGPVYFHNITGDKWGNIYVLVRTRAGYQGALLSPTERSLSVMKYNNSGDFVTAWSFSAEEHHETSATVDEKGRVYALFTGSKSMGVEIFEEE